MNVYHYPDGYISDDPLGDLLSQIERLKEENQILRIRLFAGLCIECGKKTKNQIYYPQFYCSRCGKPFGQAVKGVGDDRE